MKACAQGYRDTCRIYYDWQIQKAGVVPQGSAFSAAVRGCLNSGDISLCEATLEFEQRDPARFTPMIDRKRTEIERMLAGDSKLGGVDAR